MKTQRTQMNTSRDSEPLTQEDRERYLIHDYLDQNRKEVRMIRGFQFILNGGRRSEEIRLTYTEDWRAKAALQYPTWDEVVGYELYERPETETPDEQNYYEDRKIMERGTLHLLASEFAKKIKALIGNGRAI